MNRLRVAIVEDEIPAARLLRTLIARLRPAWEIEVLPGSVEEAVQWFAANRHPDLLFLDIQLADGTSFELLSQARPSSAGRLHHGLRRICRAGIQRQQHRLHPQACR